MVTPNIHERIGIEDDQTVLFLFGSHWPPVSAGDLHADPVILTHVIVGFGYAFAMQRFLGVLQMTSARPGIVLALLAAIVAPSVLHAEVVDAAHNGFTVRHSVSIAADRELVYQAAVQNIGDWWNSDHTVSGNAENVYLTDSIPGCFCERLGDGAGLVHLSVSFVNPGVMLRLTGGLGPLGLMGVSGNMTLEFDEDGDGTTVTLQYAVGGYMAGGLDSVANAVDGVLVEQMARLAMFVETGSPVATQ